MRVLGLIPARGGSKGVPRKNIRLLGGRPLIHYTIDAAKAASRIDRVVVTTEDAEIAELSAQAGAELPFLRPSHLAGDATAMLPVVVHAIESLAQEGWMADAVCLLQPTFPLRSSSEIDACIETFESKDADCVFSVHRVPAHYNPHWVYFSGDDGALRLSTGEAAPIARRQELPAAFHRSGSVYVTRTRVITEEGSLYGRRVFGYETPAETACNIDTEEDWERAQSLIQKQGQHV